MRMALDFTKPTAPSVSTEQVNTAAPPVPQEESYQQYDIVADRQQINQKLTNSVEVERLVSQIEV